jgi:hypothetical protein
MEILELYSSDAAKAAMLVPKRESHSQHPAQHGQGMAVLDGERLVPGISR